MPDYKHIQLGDQQALKDKTIACEPNTLRQLGLAVQNDHRLKMLPFGAIKNIRKLRINRKKIKSNRHKRITFKQHRINPKNIVRIQRHGVKPLANFTITTCNTQSLKLKELQVSELISDYSLDALIITEMWLRTKDKQWKDTTSLNRNGLKLHTSDRTKSRGGGLVLITKNHYQVKCVANHNSNLKTFECTTWENHS